MDDFLILLQAKLDEAKSKGNIDTDIEKLQTQLDKLKIQAEIDQKTLSNLTKQLESVLNQKIVISNIGIDTSGLNKSGQKAANNFSNGMSHGLKKTSNILNSFKKSLENMGMGSKEIDSIAKKINNLGVQIESLNQTRTSGKKDTLSVNIDGIDQYGQADKLTQQYDIATGELINNIDNISTVQKKAGSTTEAFIDKQKKAVASAQNTLSTIETRLNDSNITKSLANTDFNSNGLNTQLERVRTSISALENASRDTFTQAKIDVDKEITSLNNLITTLKNAEYAATSLRTKDINTVKIDESNNLNTFVQKMEQSGHYTNELKQKVENLKTQLDSVFDANTLTSYLNSLSNLETEFKSVDATAKTLEKSTKLQTNIDVEKKILQVYTSELKEAGVLTDDAKEKIQNMFYSLSKVDSQNGLTTWRAELKGVKAETDAVLKSVTQLSKKKLDEIQLSMDNGQGASEYQNRINSIIASLERYGVETKEAQNITSSLQSTFNSMKGLSGQELISQADKLEKEFKAVKASIEQAKLSYDKFNQPVSNEKATSLINRINTFLTKNTKITKDARAELQGYVQELSNGVKLNRWNEISYKLKDTENSMRGLGRLGSSLKDQFSQATENFTQWLSISSGIMFLISQTRSAISEIKELDDTLTEISKTSNMSVRQLKQLGMESYDAASKYGRTASDYLTGVQEMNRSGFYGEKGTGMAEQSLLAQAAGDLSSELADKYILALNAAYKYGGNAEKINAALDGMNSITNRNSVTMEDMAAAMTKTGTVASSYRVSIEDLSAMIGTMEAVTKLGGDEVGNAGKAILINLQNITSSKIVDTLDKANASMTEFVNGAEKLRDPISILRDLAQTFNQLDEDDPLRAEILTNIGQKYHANKLGALLQNMDMFDKMLVDYSEGEGSALEESNKSAENLTGTINKLHNSWTEFINTLVDSDGLKTGVSLLNGLVQGATNLVNALTPLGTIGLGAGLFTGFKNVGRDKMYSLML